MHHLQRHAHHVRRHLGKGGVRALADLRLADLQLERAVLVQHHSARGGFQRDGPHGGVVPEHGHADAPAHVAGLALIFPELALVVDGRHGLVQALVEGIGVQLVFGEAVHVAHRHQVAPAERDRVVPDRANHVLGVALHGPHGLGDAVAAHRAGDRLVREHRVGVHLHVRAGVQLGEGPRALGADAVPVGGVGPLIGERLQLPGRVGAVRADPGDDVAADRVPRAVADEGLLPRHVQLHQVPARLQAQPGAQRLVQYVLLVAETAADVGLDDPDPAPVHAQRLSDDAPDDVGDLGGGHDVDLVPLHVGIADEVFDVAVLHHRRLVPALDLFKPRLADGLPVVADPDLRVLQDVVGIVPMQLGRAVLHGLLHVQHEGVWDGSVDQGCPAVGK